MLFRYNIPGTAALCLLVFLPTTSALFSSGFQTFLNKEYGSTVANQLIRSDLGVNGSFGGNIVSSGLRIYREPVILVHGLNANASTLISARDFFNRQGYGIGEIYATSYGPNKTTVDASSTIQCSYVKQIRQLIQAVSAYTGGKRVVVVAYSLGSAVARKAILGGRCVDSNENLNGSLTGQVSIYLSVAGANLGASECNTFPNAPMCGSGAGLKAGSAYLKDVNSKANYEGISRYSIGSSNDDIVGFQNLSLPGSQINVTLKNFNHGDTLANTLNIQASLISRGYVSQRTVDKDSYAESKLTSQNCSGTITGAENFQVGPHASQSLPGATVDNDDDNSDKAFPGEYNRQAKIYSFWNGFNYTRHTDPTKGKFFGIRNKPARG